MTVNYAALRVENREEYGRGIGRIGKMLLEDRYDKRTHFIYEVLQNAEDALRRRTGWAGSRAVTFALTSTALRVSHFGAPFIEADVRGVCGINASTKDITSIGRFGIGFKSVYAFTERPEIHSGNEAFSITEYVFPQAIPPANRDPDETLIVLQLRDNDVDAFCEIAEGLRSLGAGALLFLKHVEEIIWTVEGKDGGCYRRCGAGDGFMREVELVTATPEDEQRQRYLLFSRDVENEGRTVGQAELAFQTGFQEDQQVVQPITDARLVVFFPTVLPTHTGFLVQGPYQTTPSRDNIPADKAWNITLAKRTGELLVDVLQHLQQTEMLSVAVLRTLPLDRLKMAGGLFQPLYDHMVEALRIRRLLPSSTGEFASASELRIARAQDVRDLFSPKQLAVLLEAKSSVCWASGEITTDRAPQLRNFLMQDLKVTELTLEQMLGRVHDGFLSEQSDTWMVHLYQMLASQPALMRGRAKDMALYRLEDGRHVPLIRNGVRQVFLPADEKTGFPTLRAALLTPQTRTFLESAGLTKPDPVDDVIHNLLPKYKKGALDTSSYAEDIARILRAFETDSQAQRDKLISALKLALIVMVNDAATGKSFVSTPGNVYLAAARMMKLFQGVKGVFLVNSGYECLRGEKSREMLEACGASRTLRTEACKCDLSASKRQAARHAAGWESYTSEHAISDVNIAGLDGLLDLLPALHEDERPARARLLWEAVGELIDRRGASVLSIQYSWVYHQTRSTTVDAKFLRRLNETPWISDASGALRLPSEVLFEHLDWPAHPVLESRIAFRPAAIAALAREVGIDPDVLDELKRLGVTDLEQLRQRLKQDPVQAENDEGQKDDPEEGNVGEDGGASERAHVQRGDVRAGEGGAGANNGGSGETQGGIGDQQGRGSGGLGCKQNRSDVREVGSGAREFISYVGSHPNGEEADPDSLTQKKRMDLEEAAIALILRLEPVLERMAAGNKGFDLIEKGVAGEPKRWIEVKAMKGTLADRPVGLSSAQMEQARRCGNQFWLYVVECAGTPKARVLKIRNPHGAAGTFTFDRGWEAIATVVGCEDLEASTA